MEKVLIVIPSRYHSTGLPGKPLVKIAGVEMIKRVAAIADYVCKTNPGCEYVVATDNGAIFNFCQKEEINVVMTSESCKNGTERCVEAVKQCQERPSLIVNLQGDNPLCPPWIIQELINAWRGDMSASLYTPAVVLNWFEYDNMLKSKLISPYSGTTVMVDKKGYAMAFSKNVIPAVRKMEKARAASPLNSPVRRHIGLYAYSYEALMHYKELEESIYEKDFIEGLEQMRFLYNGLKVRVVDVSYRGRETTSGVDRPEDVGRVEDILSRFGEFDLTPKKRLVIVRHGNTFTSGQTPTRVGARTDLPLVEQGRSRAVGRYLADKGIVPDKVYAAPLLRTMQSAELIVIEGGFDKEIIKAKQFSEIDYGPDENKTEDEVVARIGADAIEQWNSEGIVPQGWNVDVSEIVAAWMELADDINLGETALICTSNGVIRFAPKILAEGSEKFSEKNDIKVATGSVSIFEYVDGAWSCREWNVKPYKQYQF